MRGGLFHNFFFLRTRYFVLVLIYLKSGHDVQNAFSNLSCSSCFADVFVHQGSFSALMVSVSLLTECVMDAETVFLA